MADDSISKLEQLLNQKAFKSLKTDLKESLMNINASEKAISALARGLETYEKVSLRVEQTLKDISKEQKSSNKQYESCIDFTKNLTKALINLKKGSVESAKSQLDQAKAISKGLGLSIDSYSKLEKKLSRIIKKTEEFGGTKTQYDDIAKNISDVSKAADTLASRYAMSSKRISADLEELTEEFIDSGDSLAKTMISQSSATDDLIYKIDSQTAASKLLAEITDTEQKLTDKFNVSLEENVFNSAEAVKAAQELSQKKILLSNAYKVLNANVDKSGKTYLTANEAIEAATRLQEKAIDRTRLFGKAQDFLSSRTKLTLTTGALAALTWHNWSKKVQESTDLWIDSASKLPGTFKQGMKDTISRSWDMSVAMTKVDITAMKLGVDADILRNNFTYLAKTLKITDAEVISKLTSDTATLARVMGADYLQTIDAVASKVLKFGKTSGQATDELSYMYTEVTDVNDALGKTVVRLDDVSDMINEAAIHTTAYSQNTKALTGAVNQAIISLQAQGKTYRQSSDAARSMLKMFEDAPDWMQWQAGFDLQKVLRSDKKAMADLKAEMPGFEEDLEELSRGGSASARVLWDMTKTSSKGLEIMSRKVSQLVGSRGLGEAAYILQSQVGGTFAEAESMVSLFREIDESGGFENFSKGLDNNYSKVKQLAKLGVDPLARALKLTKSQAQELVEAISEGPEAGEKAYRKYRNAVYGAMIADKDATKESIAKQKGFGSATETLVKGVQKGLTATSLMSGKLFENAVHMVEDQPILTGLLAAMTGGKAILTKKAAGKISPDTEAITGGSSLKRVEMAVQYSSKHFLESIPKKFKDIIASTLGKIPGLGGKGMLASKVGLLTGGAAGKAGIAAGLGAGALGLLGGALSSYGIGKIRKEDELESKRRETGGAIGGGVGAIAGTLLLGPLGTAIGGTVGSALGSLVGKFLPELQHGFDTVFTVVKAGAIQVWDNFKSMFKDLPTAFKTIVVDGIFGKLTSMFDVIKALFQGDFREALLSAVTAIIPFGKNIRKATQGVVEASAQSLVQKEKEELASKAKEDADKKALDEAAKRKSEEDAKKHKYRGLGRSATYYKRFVTGERIDRGLSTVSNSCRSADMILPTAYQAPIIPIVSKNAQAYTPTALPQKSVMDVTGGSTKSGRTVIAKAIGMQGGKAILEILNFDSLLVQNNRTIMQATM